MIKRYLLNSPIAIHGVISQAIVLASQLLVVVLTSHNMRLHELGIYSFALVLVGLLNFTLPSGIAKAIQNVGNTHPRVDRDLLTIILLLPFFGMQSLVTIAFFQISDHFLTINVNLAELLCCIWISNIALLNSCAFSEFRILGMSRTAFYLEAASTLVVLLFVFFGLRINPSLSIFLILNILAQLLMLIVNSFFLIRNRIKFKLSEFQREDYEIVKARLVLSYKTSFLTFLGYISSQLTVILLAHQGRMELLAQFSRSILICTIPLTLLITLFSRIYYLPLSRLSVTNAQELISKVLGPLYVVAVLLFLCVSLFSSSIISLLLGDRWNLSPTLVSIAAFGSALQFISFTLLMALESRQKIKLLVGLNILQSCCSLVSTLLYLHSMISLEWVYPLGVILNLPALIFVITRVSRFNSIKSLFRYRISQSLSFLLGVFGIHILGLLRESTSLLLVFSVSLIVLFLHYREIGRFILIKDPDGIF